MIDNGLLSIIGVLFTMGGAVLLYAASPHQRLMRSAPPANLLLVAGAITLLIGLAAGVASWGGLVGGLLTLAVWMTVSVALPYLLARRSL